MTDKVIANLFKTNPPYVHLSCSSEVNFNNFAVNLSIEHKDFAVRILRGKKMHTLQSLFNEFGAVLQSPSYFGENWDAFNECINDLEWLPAKGYILNIMSANEVLSDEHDETDFDIFIRQLVDAGKDWAVKKDYMNSPAPDRYIPFHVILNADEKYFSTFKERIDTSSEVFLQNKGYDLLNLF